MSDLRVTDVQAALRHFKTLGHDVLTDPRALHLTSHPDEEPQAYRMAAGHHLTLSDNKQVNSLVSHLMQSERPLVSTVETTKDMFRGDTYYHRDVLPKVPAMLREGRSITYPESTDAEHHFFIWDTMHNSSSGPGYHYSDTKKTAPGFRTYGPNDMHAALKAHTTDALSHTGIRHTGREKKQPMSSEEMSKFNVSGAISHLVNGIQPFKGLVTVEHHDITYHYNPATEELKEHR